MNAELEKWAYEKLGHDGKHEAAFWIRALFAEIEKETATHPLDYGETGDNELNKIIAVGIAVRELKRRFGMEG